MFRYRWQCVAVLALSALWSAGASAQYRGAMQERLERLAAENPEVAQALEEMARARDAMTYSAEEFREYVRVDWMQYHVPADGKTMLSVGARGSGTACATLGAGVDWTDKETGQSQYLSYSAAIQYSEEKGLFVEVTVNAPDGEAVTTEYRFENLEPVTVLLREMPDGSRHMARFIPELDPKQRVLDYSDHLTISLSSAVLIADDEFAGEFTAAGSIVGITSARAGMRFEFGLKPFSDATPIAQTDGKTIWFDFDGRSYRLYNTGPITAPASGGALWRVYVRGKRSNAVGNGTHSMTYDSLAIQEVLDSLNR